MKMNMLKEFQNIIDYLENVFPGGLEVEDLNDPVWEDLKSMHLMNAKRMLEIATVLEAGALTSPATISEAESILGEVYSNFFTVLPDMAFTKRG